MSKSFVICSSADQARKFAYIPTNYLVELVAQLTKGQPARIQGAPVSWPTRGTRLVDRGVYALTDRLRKASVPVPRVLKG